jgi:hypothetical protein
VKNALMAEIIKPLFYERCRHNQVKYWVCQFFREAALTSSPAIPGKGDNFARPRLTQIGRPKIAARKEAIYPQRPAKPVASKPQYDIRRFRRS